MSTATPSPDSNRSEQPSARPRHRRWVRVVAWIGGSLAALLLLVVIGVVVLLHSARFHRYLVSVANNKASNALGVPVHIDNFALHLSTLSLDVYGITISGAQPFPTPPLLLVPHAQVGVRIVSLLHAKWYLNNVRIDRPVARIFTAADGASNLPHFKSSGKSKTNIFQLGIRHAVLDRGAVYYNNRKITLDADLQDVDFNSAFDKPQQKYSGNLSYRNGHLQFGTFAPIAHNLDAQFAATPTTFFLRQAKLQSGQSQFIVTATLKNYGRPDIYGEYQATLDGLDLRHILRDSSLPAGVTLTSGSVSYRYDPHASLLDSAVVNGTLSSQQLNVRASKIRTRLRNVAASYSLTNGNLDVKNFRARLLGGRLAATMSMRQITGDSRSKLTASLQGISLSDLKRTAPSSAAARELKVGGVLNMTAEASWVRSFQNLAAHADANLRASLARAGTSPSVPAVIPVKGELHGTYRAATRQIALTHSYLRMPKTTLALNGAIGTTGRRTGLHVQLTSGDLAELETIADLFRTPTASQPVQPLQLAGTASFQGIVTGSTSTPHLVGQLIASNLQVKGSKWRMLRAAVDASPSHISLQDADLEPSAHGNIAFSASAGLTKWSFTNHSPVRVELHASQIELASLEQLAGTKLPVSGTMTASVSAHGTLLNPVGHGSIAMSHATVYGEPVRSANISFTGADRQVHSRLNIHVAAGTIESALSVQPERKSYTAQITANGIRLDELRPLAAHNIHAQGTLNIRGNGQGTWMNPEFTATAQIPQLSIQQQKIQQIALRMSVANHVATANLSSLAVGTAIQANAKVNLTGDYFTEATLNTQSIPLEPLLAVYAPSEAAGLTGQTELHATLRGPLKNRKLIVAHVTVPTLQLNYNHTIHLAAASPIHVNYQDGVLNLERAAIRGTDTDLQVQGSIPTASHARMSLLVLGTVNLKLAQLFNPNVKSSGELRFNINSYGAPSDTNVEGRVAIVDANFISTDMPVGLQHGNGVLTLTRDRLNVQSFKATVGGGTVTAQGGVAYSPSIQFDLGATASGVRLLYPQGVREELAGNIRLAGTEENALLAGRVNIENLAFTPDFDLTSVAGQLSSGVAPPPSQGFAQNLQLNLAVNSVNSLNLVSRTLSVDGTANLQVRGTAANPVILGRIDVTDGDIIFNGNRYTLSGGTVEFVNPAETQPVVNLALNTTIQQYNITLRFNGPVDQMRTNYASDPALPSADIINLLAFGQTTEAAAANPTPGDQAAMSLVASGVSSQLTSRVAKVAGISQLSINPVLAGGTSQGPAGAIVSIQQRVTGNLFVTYSTNVSSTQNQVIMGQYRISPRVSLSATRDQNGGFAFDTLFKKSW